MPTSAAKSLAVAGFVLAGASLAAAQSGQPVPQYSAEEFRARTDKAIEHQHANDEVLEQFERIEEQVSRTGGDHPKVVEDKIYRLVPTGAGNMKILLKDNGRQTSEEEYRRQLLAWKDALETVLKPNDPRTKAAFAKADKKKHDRADLVDATRDAYTFKITGRETVNGHDCDIIELTPNPNFHARNLMQEALTHATVKIWIDRNALQLVRGEAHITRDVSFGGGILGKLYRGGVFFLEQTEVAPGVWLPSRYQYDFTARKFLFTFEEHQYIEASHYRRVGSPQQALAAANSELTNPKPMPADP